ncbi:FUSC family protein [Pseudomonas rhodesiae]|uniref:DUF2946 domain-containing protein n=1 Tax=Pseudomonas rhodesiae TaxID=76760 RepID=UPI003D319EC4
MKRIRPWIACLAVLLNLFAMPMSRAIHAPDVRLMLWGGFCSGGNLSALPADLGKVIDALQLPQSKPVMQHGDCCCSHAALAALPSNPTGTTYRRAPPNTALENPELPTLHPRVRWSSLSRRASPFACNALTMVAWGQTIERILSDNPKRLRCMLARFVGQHAYGCSSLEAECLDKVSESLSAIHGACDSISEGSRGTQRSPGFNRHRDWLVGLRSALRSSLVFLSAIGIWLLSSEQAALTMMIVLPVLLSHIFSSHPAPRLATAKLLGGAVIAIPVAILFVLSSLAQSSGDFETLILVLPAPLFLGLMSMISPSLTPFGLGFCLTLAVLVQPSNYVTFAIDQCLSTGPGIAGLGPLYAAFDLVRPPKAIWLLQRIIRALNSDLQKMRKKRLSTNWLTQRAAERWPFSLHTSRHRRSVGR